ncbi:Vicilin Cor a 11.0101 [Linum perenne]
MKEMRVSVVAAVLLLLLSVLVLCSATDPEKKVKECKHQCKQDEKSDEDQKRICSSQCEKKFREGGQRGSGSDDDEEHNILLASDAEKELRECREECPESDTRERARCRYHCQQKYGRDSGGGEEEEEESPYVFRDKHFDTEYRTQHGTFDVLQRFSEKSELLKGIEEFRIAVLERHSFNIESGDVFRNHAGTPIYLVNKDETQKLVIVAIVRPVNLPGSFEAFFGPGGKNPESFFSAFSPELLEAALKVEKEKIQRIFQQKEGAILKASREQIKALSHDDEKGDTSDSNSPFNLVSRDPTQGNDYGRLWEAGPDEFEQFRDLNLMVSFANITRGAMAGPFYNSKATKIAYVADGEGYFEMACPHISSSQSSRGQTYGKVRSKLTRGTVFIVPAGHPVATVASAKNDLQVLCFEVNAHGNFKFPLAGKDNVMSKMEREALELGFGAPGKEVEQIFNNQKEVFFFPGPESQQHQA